MQLTLPAHRVFYNGQPTDPKVVVDDLRSAGVPDPWIEGYLATAVPFWNEEQERDPAGRWAAGGGGGSAAPDKTKPVGSKENPVVAEIAHGKDPVSVSMHTFNSLADRTPRTQIADAGVIRRVGSSITSGLYKAAVTASDGIRGAVDRVQQLSNGLTGPLLVAMNAAGGGEGFPDKMGERLRSKFGPFTGNLIAAASHVALTALPIGLAIGAATMPHVAAAFGTASPLFGAVRAYMAGSAVSAALRHIPGLNRIVPAAIVGASKMPFKILGGLGRWLTGKAKPDTSTPTPTEIRGALQKSYTLVHGKAAMSWDDAEFADDDGSVLTCSPEDINRLAKAGAQGMMTAGARAFLTNKPFWQAFYDAAIKKYPDFEAQCKKLARGGDKAGMSVFYNGLPTPYAEARADLLRCGFTEDTVDDWADFLEVCSF